jgi:hypothetical protein
MATTVNLNSSAIVNFVGKTGRDYAYPTFSFSDTGRYGNLSGLSFIMNIYD